MTAPSGRTPEVTVAAIVERRHRFLLIEERAGGRVVLNQPAGHLEDGETLLDAVVRETREESGWSFVPRALVGVYQWCAAGDGPTILRFGFSGELHGHDPLQPLDEGILRTLWLSRAEVAQRAAQLRSPMVLRGIDDYRAGIRHPLSLLTRLDEVDPLRLSAHP